jgi:hypothetical protein
MEILLLEWPNNGRFKVDPDLLTVVLIVFKIQNRSAILCAEYL